MSFFINEAWAVGPTSGAQTDGTFSLVMIAAIFVLFYFMLIRPQNKRAKEHKELISRIKPGDEVITSGGILAKVIHIDTNEPYIKAALAENVEVLLQKGAVNTVLPKGTLKAL